MSGKARVIAEPLDSLSDEKVDIKVLDLPADCKVTLKASITSDSGELFQSYGHYISSCDGRVSVDTDRCYGGTYTGVQSMGLLTSMLPTNGKRQGVRLVKKNVCKPYIVQLELFEGHEGQTIKIASTTLRRHFMGQGVQRFTVKTGQIRGTLFLPPGNGPFPGVMDLFGTAGGIVEFKASLLASHGFAALALAYFDYDDLPKAITNVTLEYFEEALQWFSYHTMVQQGGVGLMGVSKGSELVLTLASYQPKLVRAVVAVSPAHATIAVPINIQGKPSPFVKFEPEMTRMSAEGGLDWSQAYPDHVTNDHIWHPATIAVEKIRCPIMLVYGDADGNWDSVRMAELIARRLEKYQKHNQCTRTCYHGAGHLIEPPYTPHCKNSYHKTLRMHIHWGGEADKHCHAQEDSWKKILRFLHDNLVAASSVNIQSSL